MKAERIKHRGIALALAGSIALGPPAFAWGPEGHEVVALIAMRHLTPAASAEARPLLAIEGAPDIAAVASWADEYRHSHPETGAWHYVDIPLDAAGYDPARDCPEGACVVARLADFVADLANRSLPTAEREIALKWVVHLVGDIHQPLHEEDNHDRGGNDVRVTWSGWHTNLHHAWDSDLVRMAGRDPEVLAEQARQRLAHNCHGRHTGGLGERGARTCAGRLSVTGEL
jgi:hypothetical protein